MKEGERGGRLGRRGGREREGEVKRDGWKDRKGKKTTDERRLLKALWHTGGIFHAMYYCIFFFFFFKGTKTKGKSTVHYQKSIFCHNGIICLHAHFQPRGTS